MKLGRCGMRWRWDGVGLDGSRTGWDDMKRVRDGMRWSWDRMG